MLSQRLKLSINEVIERVAHFALMSFFLRLQFEIQISKYIVSGVRIRRGKEILVNRERSLVISWTEHLFQVLPFYLLVNFAFLKRLRVAYTKSL